MRTIDEWDFIMNINWQDYEYPQIIGMDSIAYPLFRTTIIFQKIIEEMSYGLRLCDDGVSCAVADYVDYFDFLEKQVLQIHRMLVNRGYKKEEHDNDPS